MNIYKFPAVSQWEMLTRRPAKNTRELFSAVEAILKAVEDGGDAAIRKLEHDFDHAELDKLQVTEQEIDEATALVPDELQHAMRQAYQNIYRFHDAQRFKEIKVETCPGVTCAQRAVPIGKVGLYVPGGTAPLFSTVLMLATPARIAGCREVVLCTPPSREGKVNPAILFAARLAGVKRIFKIGGAQAIAAMAYGTESVPRVYKIFGPGNQYVMAAKQLVQLNDVAIDMPAGPSEVLVIADAAANAALVASDLLSQAEHGVDSQVVLCTDSEQLLEAVQKELGQQLSRLSRKDIAERSLASSRLILFTSIDDAVKFSNEYAPEHLILHLQDPEKAASQIDSAGSIFLGALTPESAGDYASGTNHTLPTKGWAHSYGGLCLDSFQRKITLQRLTRQGVASIGETVCTMAKHEQLTAHENAMRLRIEATKE